MEMICQLCGSTAFRTYKDHPGYQKPQVFDIYHCCACNTSFAHPRSSARHIYELIYKHGPNVLWYDRYWKYARTVKTVDDPLAYLAESEDTYWAVGKALAQCSVNGRSHKILEVGSGLGYLTYALNRAGYDATGLDISAEAVAKSIQNFGPYYTCADLRQLGQEHVAKYDVVVFTELIEHIDDIFGFLRSVRRLLKSNGNIILTTPNKSTYPSDAIWATDLPPVHWWWLSEESLRVAAKTLDLDISFIDFTTFNASNHRSIASADAYRIPFMQPWFDSDGSLLNVAQAENPLLAGVKRIAYSIPLVRSLKKHFDRREHERLLKAPGQFEYGKRGKVLCAMLNPSRPG